MSKGFSLVEVLVVTAIIATLSVALLFNFGTTARNRTARNQVASVIASDIRRAQSMALAGTRFGGNTVCGYGIHYLSSTSYYIYAKAAPAGGCSTVPTRNYQAGDLIAENKKLINRNMNFRSSFSDVFFESPDPKTFLNNSSVLTDPPVTITIQRVGQANCAGQTCAKIEIYTSGQINLTD
ncbi:MAG: prepilin-type N-terminal cleavage/methylation domain-containing protein [Patescibacteria group bacterium]